MNKVKKVAAVAVMVGGMALGGGVAHASDGPDVFIPNLQLVDCQQEFEGGAAFIPVQGAAAAGDNTQNIGNFCTVVGPVND
ncbi:hypothetical protein AB0D78_41225 [Streptomyces avermitilis]|uniref:hypothetical protein n=1 Tax=Streptomyces avermitilis TaxID=33903 RepID=UPI0033E26609